MGQEQFNPASYPKNQLVDNISISLNNAGTPPTDSEIVKALIKLSDADIKALLKGDNNEQSS